MHTLARWILLMAGGCVMTILTEPSTAQTLPVIPRPAPAPVIAPEDSAKYPPVLPSLDQARLGTGVQRTMRMLATSSPTRHNKVRILVYGQSISEQDWWKSVADDLRGRFPNADIDMENRAIGGFASQWLIRSAEADLYPFYPDLTILHIYGDNHSYEAIVRKLRSITTSELLIQTDHIREWPNDHVSEAQSHSLWWDHMMNDIYLPKYARQYDCGLCDVRGEWLRYLKDNHLQPRQLTIDGTHLNAQGNYLMAAVITHHLVYRPEIEDLAAGHCVTDLEAARDMKWENGRLEVPFVGNKIDALADSAGTPGIVRVLIDGKKPSQFPECYYHARPEPKPWSPLFIKRIDHRTPLILETWTYKVTSVSSDQKSWRFQISGSVTGPDGSGSSTQMFTSDSGRVIIDPQDLFRGFDPPLPVGYECTWKVLPLFTDTYRCLPCRDPAKQLWTTLAQNLPIKQSPYVLQLIAEDGQTPPIKALRIYNPPISAKP
jgi:hypothetical protein